MKIYNIQKPEKLFAKLDACEGKVDIVLPDGQKSEWAKDGELVKALWKTMPDKHLTNMELKLEKGRDALNVIDFLMRGNCA
ncbi:hypothetical protein ACH6CV_06800 [Bacillota bacterium Meth-B3]|nr:hypothetical protein [Christensenellaceae bacterium]MEA5068287.1 hypothetical protein [Christensenellaceae bacterium]